MTIRPPKKSETLEIRLPHETKQAFMARCRARGFTASDALRGFIEADAAPVRRGGRGVWQALAAAAAGLAIGAVAAPSLAQSQDDRVEFARMDADGDGVVSFEEFRARP